MNKILIVDAFASEGRIMNGLLTLAGYDYVVKDCSESAKVETTMRLYDSIVKVVLACSI